MSGKPPIKVALAFVEEPTHILRQVDKQSPKYQSVVTRMRAEGYLPAYPMEVTEAPAGGPPYVIAGDGIHRYYAASELGLEEVWVSVLEGQLTDAQRTERQIAAEASHTSARPAEFGRALRLLQEERKGITLADLARSVHQNEQFVAKALKLATLPTQVQKLLDDGAVKVGNGLMLVALRDAMAKLDPKYELPDEVVEKARVEDVAAFTSMVAKRIEDARKGPRTKREPAPRLRLAKDVVDRLAVAVADPASPPGFADALRWVLRQDPVSAAVEAGK